MARVIVMGVSGCGKTTFGEALAVRLGAPFVEGDRLHPAENVRKMSTGIPLDDDDRWPWLAQVAAALAAEERSSAPIGIGCARASAAACGSSA